MRWLGGLLFAVALGCSHSPVRPSGSTASLPTCAVLSVGGLRGVAHIGALAAMRQAGLRIDCIAGTSMGSLIAGLYATSPEDKVVDRFRAFKDAYVARTKDDIGTNGFLGALVVGVLTGGAALPTIAGGLVGAGSVDKIDRDRVVVVLDDQFNHADIEKLPIAYVTFYQEKEGDGVALVSARSGNLAQNIGRSIANPFIFQNLDVVSEGQMDPGGDRMAAVPVEDTCRVFPGHRMIALNVTGHHFVSTGEMQCPVDEVMIDVGDVNPEALFSEGDDRELQRVAAIGWKATAEQLRLFPGGIRGSTP